MICIVTCLAFPFLFVVAVAITVAGWVLRAWHWVQLWVMRAMGDR